jgi:hypothetical protein
MTGCRPLARALDSAKARAFLSILVTTRRDALGVFAIL